MKTLVIGGTGFAGGYAANHLDKKGHKVTVMGRNPPPANTPMAALPFVQGNYIEDDLRDGRLEGFDALLFAAGNDITKMPMDGSVTPEDFFKKANTEAIPKLFEAAKAAGIKRCANLGTFYPHVAPEQVGKDPYVTSRAAADEAIRAMSNADFNVCSVNAPFILGHVPNLNVSHLGAMAAYARGDLAGMPIFAPKGGTNHVNLLTVAEALLGALERGESGKAYLIGDANYSWKEYLERWFTAVGNPTEIDVREDNHPLLPNIIMYAGVGATVSYEANDQEAELLGYGRGRMAQEIVDCAKAYCAAP